MSRIRDTVEPGNLKTSSSALPPRTQSNSSSYLGAPATHAANAMDVDDPQADQGGIQQVKVLRSSPRPSSWHSEEAGSQHMMDRPSSASGFSQSWSASDNPNTSQSGTPASGSTSEDPLFHEAYRLFKASMKAASEKYGPYLPPDDGSPFLAHRLTRMWNDLSPEQRAGWYARAAGEPGSEHVAEGRSPHSTPLGTFHFTPPSTGVSATRTPYSGSENAIGLAGRMDSMDHRSPGSFTEEDHMGGASVIDSRSQSPMPGDDIGGSQSHIPRPPNAWILFRSTMSKSRRPDGAVYSPPEISVMWKELSKEDRDVWYNRAKEAKLQHEVANPGYRYQPNRKKPYGVRKFTEVTPTSPSSSARSSTRASHPAPSSPPWHMQF